MTKKLTAPDRVILFCAATGIDHAAVGIPARDMQSMAVRRTYRARSREWGVCAHRRRLRGTHRDPSRCRVQINPSRLQRSKSVLGVGIAGQAGQRASGFPGASLWPHREASLSRKADVIELSWKLLTRITNWPDRSRRLRSRSCPRCRRCPLTRGSDHWKWSRRSRSTVLRRRRCDQRDRCLASTNWLCT